MDHMLCRKCHKESYTTVDPVTGKYDIACPHCGGSSRTRTALCAIRGCYTRTIDTHSVKLEGRGLYIDGVYLCGTHWDMTRTSPDAL